MNNAITKIKSYIKAVGQKVTDNPFKSLLLTLAVLLGLMIVSNQISKKETESIEVKKQPIEVETYTIGAAPRIQAQAIIKKEGIITIQAQTSGIVQQVYKKEGERVSKGSQIAWISSTYSGATSTSTQRQLAETNYNFTSNNLAANKELIEKQRKIAEESRTNTEKLREITDKSVQESRDLLNINNELMSNLQKQIRPLEENTNKTEEENTLLNQLKAQQAQLSAGINQLGAALRNSEYQADKNNSPTALADQQKELTLKQLGLQEKSLDLQLEISRLNLQLAKIAESTNYPSSQFSGTIQRIHVTSGQTVNPGQIIATILTDNTAATAETQLTKEIAAQIARTEPSTLNINKKAIPVETNFIPSQPTEGSLFTVKFSIPQEMNTQVVHNSYTTIEIPLGTSDTTASVPFLPIDALYQTQEGAYVYVVETKEDSKIARSRKIIIGDVVGKYIEVESGLQKNDVVILNRNIIEGDVISTVDARAVAKR